MALGRRSLVGLTMFAAAVSLASCTSLADGQPHAMVEQPRAANVPGGCSDPGAGRNDRVGCYLTATQALGELPSEPLFWHIYNIPDHLASQTDRTSRSTVVEAFGRIWLYAIAPETWRPESGVRLAVIGPLGIKKGVHYTARYMEATFAPQMRTGAHAHAGPEAWYVVSGAQCLQTPDRTIIANAGEGALVQEGPPMVLSSIGTETRRSVLLVLHDSSKPWTLPHSGWQPTGPCEPV
jgi:quercetin dioxygenase-like cupin family protein